ncbi:MAG: iron donor protein CyaY [Archangium sp.]|nr:iron donor protein CyaY [Archangium sp.]
MDATYSASVSSFFKKLIAAVDAADPDVIECDSTGDMVTITATKSGAKVIVNTQRAVSQIWVAGKGEGVHFSREADGRWMDDKQKGLELGAWISECIKEASGLSLSL